MGTQFIFVVEADRKCKSDWIYIKDTMDHFYHYDSSNVKLSPVYMAGRGNYKKKEREIAGLISQYRAGGKANHSNLLYCFDCDDYDTSQKDSEFLKSAEKYCRERDAAFVWFCKDVEQVYIGRSIENSQKKKMAAAFKEREQIREIRSRQLSAEVYRNQTSNILRVLDSYSELRRKQ